MDKLKEMENYIDKNRSGNDFYTLYPFTTENIDGYIDLFDLEDKSLLTLGSSSDQAINAGLVGCKDITVFDVCPSTKFYYYLKLAALLSLEREVFLRFLCKTNYRKNSSSNPSLYRKSMFDRIKETLKSLDYESYVIWDYLFHKYGKKEISRLFTIDVNSVDSIVGCNRYLMNDEMYRLARKWMPDVDIKFIEGNVLSADLTEKYDNVWLSNVGKYLSEKDIAIMIEKMAHLLKQDGKMLMNYFYSTEVPDHCQNALYGYDYEQVIISGEPLNTFDNSILIYKKR